MNGVDSSDNKNVSEIETDTDDDTMNHGSSRTSERNRKKKERKKANKAAAKAAAAASKTSDNVQARHSIMHSICGIRYRTFAKHLSNHILPFRTSCTRSYFSTALRLIQMVLRLSMCLFAKILP